MDNVNKCYTGIETIKQISQTLETEGAVILKEFFVGSVDGECKIDYDPDKYRYSVGNVNLSSAFKTYIRSITGLDYKWELLTLKPGDYTILHDSIEQTGTLYICLNDWKKGCGGNICCRESDGATTKVLPEKGMLILIRGQNYIQYLNHHAEELKLIRASAYKE